MTILSIFLAAFTLLSPDGKISVDVNTGKSLTYSVSLNGKPVLSDSEISMTLSDGSVFGGKAKGASSRKFSVDQTVSTTMYTKSAVADKYNSLLLEFNRFALEFRAYDSGVAYRFLSRSRKELTVRGEQAEFNFAGDWECFAGYVRADAQEGMTGERQFMSSFENRYTRHPLTEWRRQAHGGCDSLAFLPVSVKTPDCLVCITEANLYNYPGMYLGNPDNSTALKGRFAPYPKSVGQGGYHNNVEYVVDCEDYIAKAKPMATFPWRVIAIADEDGKMIENDLVYLLSRPAEERDWSWVKPGKAVWEWQMNWNLRGVNFYSGVNTATYKYFIDFAAENGVQYLLMDEGWFEIGPADMMKIIPDLDLPYLCRYAAEKDVKIIVWAGTWPMKHNMEEICRHYSEMGVAGFKTDFLDRDDQDMIEFHERLAATTAKYNMVLFYHGVFKPAGLNRSYPNVLNFEGNYALENMKWPTTVEQPEYDVTLPFVRCVAGPVDINTGMFGNTVGWNWKADYNFPCTQGTRCHQIAAFVMYFAPIGMLSDVPSTYKLEMDCFKFVNDIPNVWDRTVALDSRIGEYAAVARKKGDSWYVAGMTNWDSRLYSVPTDFLDEGAEYKATIYCDGPNAEKDGRDYLSWQRQVKRGESVDIRMLGGGGFTIKLEKL